MKHAMIFASTVAVFCTNASVLALDFKALSGVNNSLDTDDPLISIGAIGWERYGPEWSDLEPTQGNWKQSVLNAYAAELDAYAGVGIKMLPVLAYGTSFSGGDKYVNLPSVPLWTNYVTKVVTTLRAHGAVYFQVWNEAYPNGAFWSGNNISEYFTNVLKPASQIIRSLGGKVVYGGYPSAGSTSISQYISWLDSYAAWDDIDVLDVHYYSTADMITLHNAAVSRGYPDLGVWQTECGFEEDRYMIPFFYVRTLHWALGEPFVDGTGVKLLWYADWAPDDPGAYGYHTCLYSGAYPWHAAPLQAMANLFTGDIVRYTNVLNNQGLTAIYDGYENDRIRSASKSIHSFLSGNKVVSAIFLNTNDVPGNPANYSLQLTYPGITSTAQVARVERVDMAGYSTTPAMSSGSGNLVVTTTPVDSASSPIVNWTDLNRRSYIFYVVVTCAAPRLTAAVSGDRVIVSWPALPTAPFFSLDSSSETTGAWQPVATAPTLSNGCYSVSTAFTNESQFFRLRQSN